jgi:hypothetical protein
LGKIDHLPKKENTMANTSKDPLQQIAANLEKAKELSAKKDATIKELSEFIINLAVKHGMSPKYTSVYNAQKVLTSEVDKNLTLLTELKEEAEKNKYSSLANFVKGFRKTGEEKLKKSHYENILPPWTLSYSEGLRRHATFLGSYRKIDKFIVELWAPEIERYLNTNPSEFDLNYVKSEWSLVSTLAEAQILLNWVLDRIKGIPPVYATTPVDLTTDLLSLSEVTLARVGPTVIAELTRKIKEDKLTITKRQYEPFPANAKDLTKFYWLFEKVTSISLDSQKLTSIQEYLCKSGYAICYGPLDYVITDKVTLQLFIDAIESRRLSPQESNSEGDHKVFVPTEITPENSNSLLSCLELLSHDPRGWGVVPANAPRPF